jgi:hypothetical protein
MFVFGLVRRQSNSAKSIRSQSLYSHDGLSSLGKKLLDFLVRNGYELVPAGLARIFCERLYRSCLTDGLSFAERLKTGIVR